MLAEADAGLAPEYLAKKNTLNETIIYMKQGQVFSEQILEYLQIFLDEAIR